MVPPAWGIPAIVVVGTLLVVLALLADRRSARRVREALDSAPDTPIPGFSPAAQPTYTPPEALAASTLTATDAQRDLVEQRPDHRTVPAGVHDEALRPVDGFAVVEHPAILITNEPIPDARGLLTILGAVRRRGGPAVWVAPSFTDATLDTLGANALSGRLTVLPIPLPDAAQRSVVVERTGAEPVPAADIDADYLPASVWGTCRAWIANAEASWLLADD